MEKFNAEAVFKKQKKACGKFFRENLPEDVSEPVRENVYDITGFDAEKVVALLSRIVNDRQEFMEGKTFYLLLNSHGPRQDDNGEKFFKFAPNPSRDQPGNAMVSRGLKGKGLTYETLNAELESKYDGITQLFAQHIKSLFQNNSVVPKNCPQATYEVYILLLFEIARRLVKENAPTEKKKKFDDLPIGSAIARSVKLLELGKETCSFDHVFCSSSEKFYCYAGDPEKREKAIHRINKTAHSQIERMTHLKELEEMFRSSPNELAGQFGNMTLEKESRSDTERD